MAPIRVCTFCPQTDHAATFSSNQKLRAHVMQQHDMILKIQSAGCPPKARSATASSSTASGSEAVRSFLCPCCSSISMSRDEYTSHVANHTYPIVDLASYESWIVAGVDVMASFLTFYQKCVNDYVTTGNNDIDRHFASLLPLSSILFVQRRTEYDELPKDLFPPHVQRALRENALSRAPWTTMDAHDAARIKDILHGFQECKASLLQSRLDLLVLASKQDDASRPVTIAVADLLSSLQELERGRIQELDLDSAFIRPLMNALFVHEDHDHFAARSADLIPEGMDMSMRPDFEVRRFENYEPAYRTCFGELKGEGSATMISAVRDLYKLAMFSKMEIVGNQLTGVLVFQAIGPKITFFLHVHPCPGLFTFVEVCTIDLPKMKSCAKHLVNSLDDLRHLVALHKTIQRASSPVTPAPTLPFEFVQAKMPTLPRKRRPSIGSIG